MRINYLTQKTFYGMPDFGFCFVLATSESTYNVFFLFVGYILNNKEKLLIQLYKEHIIESTYFIVISCTN